MIFFYVKYVFNIIMNLITIILYDIYTWISKWLVLFQINKIICISITWTRCSLLCMLHALPLCHVCMFMNRSEGQTCLLYIFKELNLDWVPAHKVHNLYPVISEWGPLTKFSLRLTDLPNLICKSNILSLWSWSVKVTFSPVTQRSMINYEQSVYRERRNEGRLILQREQ